MSKNTLDAFLESIKTFHENASFYEGLYINFIFLIISLITIPFILKQYFKWKYRRYLKIKLDEMVFILVEFISLTQFIGDRELTNQEIYIKKSTNVYLCKINFFNPLKILKLQKYFLERSSKTDNDELMLFYDRFIVLKKNLVEILNSLEIVKTAGLKSDLIFEIATLISKIKYYEGKMQASKIVARNEVVYKKKELPIELKSAFDEIDKFKISDVSDLYINIFNILRMVLKNYNYFSFEIKNKD